MSGYTFEWTGDEYEAEWEQDEDGCYANPTGTIRFECQQYPGLYWMVDTTPEIVDAEDAQGHDLDQPTYDAIEAAAHKWFERQGDYIEGAIDSAQDALREDADYEREFRQYRDF